MIKILVGAAIGAVIGYITNYIAIKMLFRPLEEKRVFGIRVPFTPGLIPKEKSRIAKSVGEAVGKYLLSSEAILESLKTLSSNSNGVSSLKIIFLILYAH